MNTENNSGVEMYDNNILQGLEIPSDEDQALINNISDSDGSISPIKPDNFDRDIAQEKGLAESGILNERFFILQTLYRQVFEEYLLSAFDLSKYEEMISNSEYEVAPLPLEYQNYYQKHSTMGLSYIYLRNNIHIERLSIEQLDLMDNYLINDGSVTKAELSQMILDSYIDVIKCYPDSFFEGYNPIDGPYIAVYDHGTDKSCENDAIVFEISYNFASDTDIAINTEQFILNKLIPLMVDELTMPTQKNSVAFFIF